MDHWRWPWGNRGKGQPVWNILNWWYWEKQKHIKTKSQQTKNVLIATCRLLRKTDRDWQNEVNHMKMWKSSFENMMIIKSWYHKRWSYNDNMMIDDHHVRTGRRWTRKSWCAIFPRKGLWAMGRKDNGPLLDRDASNCKKMQKIAAKYPKI